MATAFNRRARKHRRAARACDSQAVYPTFTVGSVPASTPMPHYARFIGRVGALAVALGVGAAVATGTGVPIARADDTTENPPADQPADNQPAAPQGGEVDDPPGAGADTQTPTVVINGEPLSGASTFISGTVPPPGAVTKTPTHRPSGPLPGVSFPGWSVDHHQRNDRTTADAGTRRAVG
ncbi:hypothetical protein [Mycolicibacterium arenosum]|uniref:Uncharacterized protein n=1 Tax=Mycolicibacterium arenosum TaxID=2952157 RepID=A0ABT1M6Y8_9MYCO|nr:hypothetical protein [Mycolicibacterium sp. CAU 1645]MCP9273567.1 hypothetical protein [Mycolicibacterium sp. CAU 1645]